MVYILIINFTFSFSVLKSGSVFYLTHGGVLYLIMHVRVAYMVNIYIYSIGLR